MSPSARGATPPVRDWRRHQTTLVSLIFILVTLNQLAALSWANCQQHHEHHQQHQHQQQTAKGKGNATLSSSSLSAASPHPAGPMSAAKLMGAADLETGKRHQGLLLATDQLAASAKRQNQEAGRRGRHSGRSQAQGAESSVGGGQQSAVSLSSSLLRAYIRANSMRAYHLDLHSYRPEAKFSGDPEFVNSSNPDHVERCRGHLQHYEGLLSSFYQADPMDMSISLDSMRLADTFGRPDAGLLDGHQFWVGYYESCIDLSIRVPHLKDPLKYDDDDNDGKESHKNVGSGFQANRGALQSSEAASNELVKSHYCLGLAQFPSWNKADTKTSIRIGLCFPETCTSSMLNEQQDLFELSERMMKYQLGGPGQPLSRLRLRSVYCLPHETSPARQLGLSGKLFIALISLLILANLYATLHDYFNAKIKSSSMSATTDQDSNGPAANGPEVGQAPPTPSRGIENEQRQEQEAPRSWRKIFVESFSLIRNFDKLTKTREQGSVVAPRPDDQEAGARFDANLFFNSITGIKCIGLIWIIGAHTFLIGPITHKNINWMDNLTNTYLANIYFAANLVVDSFFALSGLLASYLIFKSQQLAKMRPSHWIIFIVHRYWRLTSIYLLFIWVSKSISHLQGEGPFWDYATAPSSPRLNCMNESWWQALLHLSDFKSPKNHCIPFAWFVANSFKFAIITPVFLTVLHHSMKRGYALIGASILANIVLVFWLAINSTVDMKSVVQFKPESADNMLDNMQEIYTRPYSRIGAYLVGLLAGHIIYRVEAEHRPLQMSEKLKILIWTVVSVTVMVLTFVVKILGNVAIDDAAIPLAFSISSCLIRPLWALCTCWLVFAVAHGQARWLGKFLSARVWQLLAKLSFCAYFAQAEVIVKLYLNNTNSSPFFYKDMATRHFIATAVTLVVSFIVVLLVELPLIGIEELVLPRNKNSSSRVEQKVGVEKMANGAVDVTSNATFNHQSTNGTKKGEKLKEL